LVVYVLNFHGQELQEPFGVIIKGIKKTYFSAFPGKYWDGWRVKWYWVVDML
jgi:hypothetical protein